MTLKPPPHKKRRKKENEESKNVIFSFSDKKIQNFQYCEANKFFFSFEYQLHVA